MTGSPAVTVIVPALNAERTIGALLTALRTQVPNVLGEAETVVVDNGSTDATCSVVEAAVVPGLRIVSAHERGVAAARNRGLAEARGDVVAIVDSDCIPVRTWLRDLVGPFADNSVVIVAGGLASYIPQSAAQRFAARYGLSDASHSVTRPVMPFANGRNMAVRASAARTVGGWPPLSHGEDIEFSYLIRQRFGCQIVYRPTALTFHQDRSTDEELRDQAFGYGRGMAMVYARHPELLSWGWRERARRTRMSARRRVRAAATRIAAGVSRRAAEDAEFARYLQLWDRSFWSGFDNERAR